MGAQLQAADLAGRRVWDGERSAHMMSISYWVGSRTSCMHALSTMSSAYSMSGNLQPRADLRELPWEIPDWPVAKPGLWHHLPHDV